VISFDGSDMRHIVCLLTLALIPIGAHAQQSSTAGNTAQQNQNDPALLRLPTVTVTVEKQPEEAQKTPVSVTAVTKEMLDSLVPQTVSDAAVLAPNTWFNEFTARKLSNPRFRGIGSSPGNPGITTYIDGVPQLNANSSSLELAGVEQIEFVRGPQSALYGRNSIGGLINITSARPSLSAWTGSLVAPFGNFGAAEVRGAVSGPLMTNKAGVGVVFGYSSRDGFTKNDVTGHDLDSRSAFFSKSQLFFTAGSNWEARAILTTERARDGDYALNDLEALRARPFHAARNFEGFTHRDIVAPTFQLHRTGGRFEFSSITGVVAWKTDDSTDLDYTPYPLATRSNHEEDLQFTQEVRLSSGKDGAIALGDRLSLAWQSGLFVFTQNYDQDAVNSYAPFLVSPLLGFPVSQHSPQSSLDDRGAGGYGRGTFTFAKKLEATIGVRGDYEKKKASLASFYSPAIAPPSTVTGDKSFSDVSPQFTLAYHVTPAAGMVYVTANRGFKAGGYNAASLPGRESYGQEHSWNYEAGAKTLVAEDRLSINADVFFIQWDDLQVNVPNPFVPGQFFIVNTGGAASKGVEAELNARLFEGCDFFGGVGYTHATFDDGSVSNGFAVGGKRISNTPRYTADVGGQYLLAVTSKANVYGRAELIFRGRYDYDDANTEHQEAYSIANFRAGVRGKYAFGEAWVRNAFDTRYIPVAFAYPGLAPSGFVGEMGAPRTYGVRAGLTF
jgi:iron complex outermembrane receptor protein